MNGPERDGVEADVSAIRQSGAAGPSVISTPLHPVLGARRPPRERAVRLIADASAALAAHPGQIIRPA
jgi:hypothetical protein